MRLKNCLLFVTCKGERCEEGLTYALHLAKIMKKEMSILLVSGSDLMKRLENIMSAVVFAEAGEHETAKTLFMGDLPLDRDADRHVSLLVDICRNSGVSATIQTEARDLLTSVKDVLGNVKGIDIVLLSPSVIHDNSITAKELKKLIRTASRPIVTMTREMSTA